MLYDAESSLPCPLPVQIALAAIILKQKPDTLSIEDYVVYLRDHISSQPSASPAQLQQRIDSSRLWKKFYEESEAARAVLLDRVYDLERRHSAGGTGSLVVNKAKRKHDEQPATKANSHSKRRALSIRPTDIPAIQSDSQSEPELPEETEARKILTPLLRMLANLRQQLHQSPSNIPVAIRILCKAALTSVSDATDLQTIRRKNETVAACEDMTTTTSIICSVVIRSYPSLLEGLNRLHSIQEQQEFTRAVEAQIVYLFQGFLGQIHAILLLDATATHETQVGKTNRGRQRFKELKAEIEAVQIARHKICQDIVKLLARMVTLLDLSKPSETRLLEGILCALLDHLGSSLSLVVFTAGEEGLSCDVSSGILAPQGIRDVEGMERAVVLKTAAKEAPYLVYLLKRILIFLDLPNKDPLSASENRLSFSKSSNSNSRVFLRRAKERLQNTLLRGMFGNEDEAFRNALRRADEVDNLDVREISSDLEDLEEGSSAWYVGEVWKCIGWQILSEEVLGS